ncbi:MAG: hypothetical protein HKN36_12970 [Hellea sp.]|nr:hypothetical protein [Hellea sp.]
MTEHDWIWCANEVAFKPSYSVHKPEFGKQAHEFMSPFWMFELALPPKDMNQRREIESFLARTEGIGIVNVYDPRLPVPAYYMNLHSRSAPQGLIPPLTVKAMDRDSSSVTISGQDGDLITTGDPIAFTHDGVRYYFKSHQDLWLDGTDQTLEVFIRPRISVTGLDILAEREKPTLRFLIQINETGGRTGINRMTHYRLAGVEYWVPG